MKKVICINNSEREGVLKLNIEYAAVESEGYYIINFGRVEGKFRKDRFKEV